MSVNEQSVTVPLEAVVAATAAQRNAAHDRMAHLEAYVEQLVAERDEARDEVERLRAEAVS